MENKTLNDNGLFRINELYTKIQNNEKKVEDLSDAEKDMLIDFLKERIKGKEQEMNIIKNRILNLKKKIK